MSKVHVEKMRRLRELLTSLDGHLPLQALKSVGRSAVIFRGKVRGEEREVLIASGLTQDDAVLFAEGINALPQLLDHIDEDSNTWAEHLIDDDSAVREVLEALGASDVDKAEVLVEVRRAVAERDALKLQLDAQVPLLMEAVEVNLQRAVRAEKVVEVARTVARRMNRGAPISYALRDAVTAYDVAMKKGG